MPAPPSDAADVGTKVPPASLFSDVPWSPAYLAFLVYVFVITTYRLSVGTVAMSVALLMLPMERRPLRLPPVAVWAIAFLGWAFVGWSSSAYPDVVWDRIIEFAKICAVTVVAVNVLTTRGRFRLFILIFLASFAFFPVRGALFNYFLYGGTMGGRAVWSYSYSNPNDLAGVCLVHLALAAGLLVSERTRWVRLCAGVGVVVLPVLVVLTQSRGAFIALAAFAAVALKGQWRRGKMLLLAGAVGAVVLFTAPDSFWDRMGTLKQVANKDSGAQVNDEGSAEQRLEIWKVARTIIAENPMTGVGLGAYPQAHFVYSQRRAFDPTALGYRDTHSTYLNIFAETGLVGMLLFLAIIVATAVDAERARRRFKAVDPYLTKQLYYMLLGLIAYLVAGIWGSYGELVPTYLYLSLISAAAQLVKEEAAPGGAPVRRGVARPVGAVPGVARRAMSGGGR
jgi:probable O-glycosylation ligase (exosortase A-associated)